MSDYQGSPAFHHKIKELFDTEFGPGYVGALIVAEGTDSDNRVVGVLSPLDKAHTNDLIHAAAEYAEKVADDADDVLESMITELVTDIITAVAEQGRAPDAVGFAGYNPKWGERVEALPAIAKAVTVKLHDAGVDAVVGVTGGSLDVHVGQATDVELVRQIIADVSADGPRVDAQGS